MAAGGIHWRHTVRQTYPVRQARQLAAYSRELERDEGVEMVFDDGAAEADDAEAGAEAGGGSRGRARAAAAKAAGKIKGMAQVRLPVA